MKLFHNLELRDRLVKEFGLTVKLAEKAIKTYLITYIKESLEIIKLKISKNLIKNIPAYTLTVLKNDYTVVNHKQEQSLL